MSVTFSSYQPGIFQSQVGWTEDANSPRINVSSANARRVMEMLGLNPDEDLWDYPAMPAGDFIARVLMATAAQPQDEGSPWYEEPTPGGMTWVECGRRAGWDQEVLANLRELADYAVRTGGSVCWS